MRGRFGRKRILGAYLALLAASHVIRAPRADLPPRPGQATASITEATTGNPVRMSYWEWAPEGPEGAPVLLLHGSPGTGSVFGGLGRALGQERRVVAPDLPGFGTSTRRVPDYSIRAHAEMVVGLLDSLRIPEAHVVGFSMGGGVGLEMYRSDPARIASLTMLSAIGVQEFELLGDYHLNHAIHGLQLAGIWALTELLPHFGLLDGSFFGTTYARNFYDTDQRPLRGILEGFEPPMLIVHGDEDPLVPAGAAQEHHRIVPQSQMLMLTGDHFMTFQRPGDLAPQIARFLDDVEDGSAVTRATADPARTAAARLPFDPADRPPATGFALVVTLALIAAATFVSEDLTSIGTGLLVARGSLPWIPGILACLVGIWVGDLMLYAGGRFIGRPLVRAAPIRWFIREEALERSCEWFTHRSGPLVLWGRFVPGTRLPSYVAAGVVHLPFLLFAFWALVAGILWTPLLVGAAAVFGSAAAGWIDAFNDRAFYWLVVTALAALVALRLLVPLATRSGRSAWRTRIEKLHRWEFWPPAVFYLPVVPYVGWLAVRHRSPTVFTAANPAIPSGGFVGESKSRILSAIRDPRVAPFHLVEGGDPEDRMEAGRTWAGEREYPVVVKPDVGERGAGVEIVRHEQALLRRLAEDPADLLLQEFVPGPELGIFYYRIPGNEAGQILGITEKRLPTVVGDGSASVRELILADSRLRCQADLFRRRLGRDEELVPAPGEAVTVAELGNHCLGCEFRDGAHHLTPSLMEAVDQVSRSFDGFFFGRYDVRGPSHLDIQRGDFRVIEVNGVSSEATNIYDPDGRLVDAYRTLFRQWSLAFRIGSENRKRGVAPVGAMALLAEVLEHFRPGGRRWAGRG